MSKLSLRSAISTLKQSRKIIAIVAIVWILFMVAGAIFNESMRTTQDLAREQARVKLKLIPHTFLGFFGGLLLNNALIAVSMICGGFFIILPFIQGFFNSFVAGSIIYNIGSSISIAFPFIFIEFAAIILSCSLGVYVALGWLNKKRSKEVWSRIWRSLVVFLWIILPLLVIAAAIESALMIKFV